MGLSRQQREAQEADSFLESIEHGPTPQDPDTDPAENGGITPPADPVPQQSQAADPSDALRAEVARLQAMLADENSPTYRHRFEVLQGKYNAEIPRLAAQVKELQTKLESAPAAPAAPAPPKPEYDAAYNDLVDEHGPSTAKNLITIAQAIAQDIVAQQLDTTLQERLRPYDERVAQLAQGQKATAEQQFFTALERAVPDWKRINGWGPEAIPQDPRFSSFLDRRIPGTHETFNDALIRSYRAGDVELVRDIFETFKQEQAPATPAPVTPQKGVEQYIDPGKTGRGNAPPVDKPKTYSQEVVNAFFDSRVKGTFRGTREEAAALEEEYTRAIYEGRVS